MLTIDDPRSLRYKGENHWIIAEETGMDPDQVLCMMAQWRPGYDENNQPYLRDDGTVDVERQDDELYDYIVYFWNLKIPRQKNPTCSGCTAPFKIIADAYYARHPLIIMQASRGASKAQPLDAQVLTPTGYRLMGDLGLGDEVIDMEGNSVRVWDIVPQGEKPVYRVSFNDGTSTLVCDDHLWWARVSRTKWSKAEKDLVENPFKVVTTQEMRESVLLPCGDQRWRIPIVEPVNFEPKEQPLDPYLLGLLIGDGSLNGASIRYTTADAELAQAIAELLPSDTTIKKAPYAYRPYDYMISHAAERKGRKKGKNSVQQAIQDLNLQCTSHFKFIPQGYKCGSVEQRLALLQGLMDTDGTVGENGHDCSFSSASKQLVEDVVFIVQSLGGTAFIRKGNFIDNKQYYTCGVKLPICPFRLTRKVRRWIAPTKYPVTRVVTSIEYEKTVECQCIAVTSPTASYVTNDFIVTHNSAMLTTLSATEMCTLACWIDVLGASEKQSLVIQSYLNNENPRTKGSWWDSPRAPLGLRDPKNDLVARQRLINGGQIEALTASHKTVRGRRPVRLRIDELDEAELHLIKSAQGCPRGDAAINAKAQTLMSSTHQHLDGTMSFYLNLAREQNKKVAETGKGIRIPVYKFCYRDVLTTNGGFIDPEEIEELKATIDPETWDREFENNEPSAGGRIFRDHQIDYLFDKTWLAEPGRELLYEGAPDTPIEIDFESPTNKIFPPTQDVVHGGVREIKRRQTVRDHLGHFCGADYANDIDWSIFTRLTTNTLEAEEKYYMTGWYRTARRDTIKEIVHEYNDFVNAYENSMGAHDETGNKMVNDEIECDSEPFTFSRVSKKEILSLMIKMIQDKKIKGPYIDYAYKEFKFLTQDHVNGKKHLPDSVASLALACYAASQVEHGGFECEAVFG